jgi:hypothetical protein
VGAVGADIRFISKLNKKLMVDSFTVPAADAVFVLINEIPEAISKTAVLIEINFLIMM